MLRYMIGAPQMLEMELKSRVKISEGKTRQKMKRAMVCWTHEREGLTGD